METVMMLLHGDCLELMQQIPNESVELILCDLPYGKTSCAWDAIIQFEPLWEQYNRILKDNGAIVLFGIEPFSSMMRMSNLNNYKYDWIWVKHKAGNFALGKIRPLSYHENISVFCGRTGKINYYPQKVKRESPRVSEEQAKGYVGFSNHYEIFGMTNHKNDFKKYDAEFKLPSTVLRFNAVQSNSKEKVKHPTQKPVALLEYLIRTYTKEGETVLDNCMGSGSTGVACVNTGREFIGIELDADYYAMAKQRIQAAMEKKKDGDGE